ncbi:hypothetical protein [Streptomyces rubellomurinus]|uniref:Ig-like domain-containing protein n=2 Tax=Streptomyces TaxID=1883 RepID=A0A0F2TAP0_STRR3|nr:hypothetical protein [Streptomyces rubellomurinus]KJS52926.1 hypothetical protein VM98_28355 [Streptomyces rubellomurinus subsp. indigoferus]KJS60258.1 hypothetical protein VM95_22220 [Streptomyces rubellomurinus]
MTRLRAVAVTLGCTAAALALTMGSAQAAPGDTTNVCASTLTPSGYVDVQWWNSAGCGSGFAPNAKQIKQLTGLPVGTVVNACSSTYPPAGWTIVSSFYSSSCQYSSVPSFNNNSWQLKRTS